MAARAFFISETYLKDNSPLPANIDVAEIYPFAKTAEDIYIQDAIGTKLYEDLITKINSDSTLASYPDELTLVRKLRDALLWYTIYDALPFIATKIRNIGLVQQAGENLTNADKGNEWALRKECKEKADFYLERVQRYLCSYHSLFPLYRTNTKDDVYPDVDAPGSGLDIAFDNDLNYIDTKFFRKWLSS
jgi:hypothetical protein